MDFQKGEILLFDKPLGWTSFDVVNRVRRLLCRFLGVKKLKVGHAGTLDPLATGVMVVCTGKRTKDIEHFQYQTKEYISISGQLFLLRILELEVAYIDSHNICDRLYLWLIDS